MGKKVEEQEVVQAPVDKSLLTSHEVEEVVQGNDKALEEQMEKAKLLADEQRANATQLSAVEKNKPVSTQKQDEIRKQELLRQQMLANQQGVKQPEKAQKEYNSQITNTSPDLQKELQQQSNVQQQEFQKQQEILKKQQEAEMQLKKKQEAEELAKLNATSKGGPSKFKTFLAIILIIFFFAFVFFLPQITDFINTKKSEQQQIEITTGNLICTMSKNTDTLDVDMTATFAFINNGITKLTFNTTSTGDKLEDKDELETLNKECTTLKNEVYGLDGISTVCLLNNGVNTKKQIFDYEKIDVKKVTSTYVEAGGIYPEYKSGDKISEVESKMVSSGYKCSKSE